MDVFPPVRREVLVEAEPAAAFAGFTDSIGAWWPLADHGVYGADASVAFVDGLLVEQAPSGERSTWGTVTHWEHPRSLALSWHPGDVPPRATHLAVSFVPVAPGWTRVRLEHAGWENVDEPEQTRANYNEGWVDVLERYRANTAGGGAG